METKVIAEIGWNFMGDMDLAHKMIFAAKECGATIAKFQYWNPSRLKSGPWDQDGRRQIYEKAQLDGSKIRHLMEICDKAKIGFLVSAFNVVDAQFLKSMDIKEIKIPSHEVANFDLHKYAASNFDSIYVSLGAGTEEEVEKATKIYRNLASGKYWVAMHCVSSYPCPPEKANIPRLDYLRSQSECIGYSDHTSDIVTPAIAVARGASVIEKHFTIDKNLPGRDNKFALNSTEFSSMVENIRLAEKALVCHGNGPLDIENDTMTGYRGRWGANL